MIIKRFLFLCKVGGREVTHLMGGEEEKVCSDEFSCHSDDK